MAQLNCQFVFSKKQDVIARPKPMLYDIGPNNWDMIPGKSSTWLIVRLILLFTLFLERERSQCSDSGGLSGAQSQKGCNDTIST